MIKILTAVFFLSQGVFGAFDAFALDFESEINKNEQFAVQIKNGLLESKSVGKKTKNEANNQKEFQVVLLPKAKSFDYTK